MAATDSPRYVGSKMWLDDVRKARANWKIVAEERRKVMPSLGEAVRGDEFGHEIVMVEAEAGTGSAYRVVVTPLGMVGRGRMGGPALVSVISPWSDTWALQYGGHLALSYVAEHLCEGRFRADRLHGGDAAALTLTIAYALGRYEDAELYS